GASCDLFHHGPVVALQTAAEGVRQEFLGDALSEGCAIVSQQRLQFAGTLKGAAIGKCAGSIDGEVAILRTPMPDRVEVLERKAYGVHLGVARSARRIIAMFFHLRTHRTRGSDLTLVERGHVWRRWRNRRVQEILQN